LPGLHRIDDGDSRTTTLQMPGAGSTHDAGADYDAMRILLGHVVCPDWKDVCF